MSTSTRCVTMQPKTSQDPFWSSIWVQTFRTTSISFPSASPCYWPSCCALAWKSPHRLIQFSPCSTALLCCLWSWLEVWMLIFRTGKLVQKKPLSMMAVPEASCHTEYKGYLPHPQVVSTFSLASTWWPPVAKRLKILARPFRNRLFCAYWSCS